MPSLGSFLDALARHTRPDRAASWDPVGLQFGDPTQELTTVAVCHEVTQEVVARLLADPPQLVVSYHPLLFRATTRLVAGPSPAGRAWRLISAGVALAVTHTDFDASPDGTAEALSDFFDLGEAGPFAPIEASVQVKVVTFAPAEVVDELIDAMAGAGAGVIGNYDRCSFRLEGVGSFGAGDGADPVVGKKNELNLEPEVRLEMIAPAHRRDAVVAALARIHPYEEPAFDVYQVASNHGFVGRVGRYSGTLRDLGRRASELSGAGGMRLAGDPEARIEVVAVVPGSGGSMLPAAAAAGAEAIVTGDVSHHQAVASLDAGVSVVDPGHAATELPGLRRLTALIESLGVEVLDLVGDGSGPWTRAGGS